MSTRPAKGVSDMHAAETNGTNNHCRRCGARDPSSSVPPDTSQQSRSVATNELIQSSLSALEGGGGTEEFGAAAVLSYATERPSH